MPGIPATSLLDLVAGTRRARGIKPPSFSLIAQELQEYPVLATGFKKGRVKMIEGSYGMHAPLMATLTDVAKHDGLFGVDDVSISDHLTTYHVDFIQGKTHWAIERRQVLMNRGPDALADLVNVQKTNGMLSLAALMEEGVHNLRGVNDTLDPNGLPMYIVWNATTGFTGGAPTGHTTVGNVNPTLYPNYKNWSDTYVDVTYEDLILKLVEASMRCSFTTPFNVQQYKGFSDSRITYLVNMATYLLLKIIKRNQNENIGGDLDEQGNMLMFRGNPVVWTPQFETINHASGSDPVYCVNHQHFFPTALVGDLFVESDPLYDGSNHNVVKTFVDISYNWNCLNRKRLAIVAKADPWP